MASTALRKEEGIGLAVAVALHAAVLAALMIRPPMHDIVKPPQRIEVTISDIYGKTSMSPDPFSKAAPDRGPVLGEPAPPPEPAAPEPQPQAAEEPQPQPAPPKPKPAPKPVAKAVHKPKPRPKPAPVKTPPKKSSSRKSSAIDDIIAKPSRSTQAPSSKGSKTPRKSGASSFAQAFSDGVPGATSDSGKGMPAAEFGPRQVSALAAAINRQLKPYWQAPQGADADLLVTRVRFRLNPDGSLKGEPQVLSTSGQTAANKAQVQRHQEQAVRAVKLAAPFDLPEDLYQGWKVITTNFDRKLSQ
ncbi:TonB C-terminal domain-containing protein [Novosphingobium beihaiensis]|uniref:Cell division and transport-associated protein TolA n=1 Tax=Novosphingobium beihaiensis TaxID=2930389 RepID=A0ABT0BNK5_9SPHN|nr:TonB C-terminal domain-containing protein [Novosphingobium beihaiensis]MCJ2186632.1 hypothetical protein [Novosphingobium beihaiensis]